MAMSIQGIWEKILGQLTWDKLWTSLPILGMFAVGIFAVDKMVDLEKKLEPVLRQNQYLNDSSKLFTGIDNLGDNLQMISSLLGVWDVKLDEDEIKKVADFLQNVGTSGKWLKKLYEIFVGGAGTNLLGFSGNSGTKRI